MTPGGRLEGKAVLITGAGSGMGAEATIRFAREGARVAACDLNLEAVQRVVDTVKAAGGQATAIGMNVAKEQEVKAAVATAIKAYGKLDVLYNNAGIFPNDDNSVVNTEEKD